MKWVWLLFHLLLLLLFHLGGFLHKPIQTGFRHGSQHAPHKCMRTKRRQSAKHRVRPIKARRETTMSYVYFRTRGPKDARFGTKYVYICIIYISANQRNSNFRFKRDERKSKSLTTGEEPSVSRTLMQALGTRIQEGSSGESPERLDLSVNI